MTIELPQRTALSPLGELVPIMIPDRGEQADQTGRVLPRRCELGPGHVRWPPHADLAVAPRLCPHPGDGVVPVLSLTLHLEATFGAIATTDILVDGCVAPSSELPSRMVPHRVRIEAVGGAE